MVFGLYILLSNICLTGCFFFFSFLPNHFYHSITTLSFLFLGWWCIIDDIKN